VRPLKVVSATNRGYGDRTAVLRDLATAAHPYGLRVEQSTHSTLPHLVFLRPSDGAELGRLFFFEPERSDPFMRTIILKEVTQAEQGQLETHLAAGLLPLVTRVFSYPLWMDLVD
jgi:hypothetical protein